MNGRRNIDQLIFARLCRLFPSAKIKSSGLSCHYRCKPGGGKSSASAPARHRTRQDSRRLRGAGIARRFSNFPKGLELDAPMLGEHNEYVLTQHPGYSTARVRELGNIIVLRSGRA